MSQRNSCSVSFFSSDSFRGHWNRFSVRRLYSRMYGFNQMIADTLDGKIEIKTAKLIQFDFSGAATF